MELKDWEKELLSLVQRDFPLKSRPYLCLAESLGLSEEEVLWSLARLKEAGLIRLIGAIFQPSAVGYRSSLAALSLPESGIEQAAEIINAYPGVSHNYLRNHRFNLWFTVAVPPGKDLEGKIREFVRQTQARDYLILPIVKTFKIAVILDLESNNGPEGPKIASTETRVLLSPEEERIARAVQEDLPLVREPFKALAVGLGLEEATLIGWIKKMLSKGVIRRFAALLRHTRAGFSRNAMVAWMCPEERIDLVGPQFAALSEISHCYLRRSYPHWPYNLYTMIHGRNQEDCRAIVEKMITLSRLKEPLVLYSLKEFKKSRLKLFWEEP
ncbi:siroheme decarboxylase subunit alpha [Thermosulfuriphilus sp.]